MTKLTVYPIKAWIKKWVPKGLECSHEERDENDGLFSLQYTDYVKCFRRLIFSNLQLLQRRVSGYKSCPFVCAVASIKDMIL